VRYGLALRKDKLPVMIGKITVSKMAEDAMVMDHIVDVPEAQALFTKAGRGAAHVTITDELNHRADAWHYDTHGCLRLGKAFAAPFLDLDNTCLQGRTS
jgi:hypothetical protein